MLPQISPESCILTFEVPFPVWYESPRDYSASCCECGSDQEYCLNSLEFTTEGVLDWCEDLQSYQQSTRACIYRHTCVPIAAPALPTAAASPRKCPRRGVGKLSAPHKNVATPGPISPKALNMPYLMHLSNTFEQIVIGKALFCSE